MDKKKLQEIQKQLPDHVTLIAVSKTHTKEEVDEAYTCGCLLYTSIVYQIGQTFCFIDDDLYILRCIFAGNIPHNLAVSANHRQRCSQVMTHIRNQLASQILHLAKLSGSIIQRLSLIHI